MAPGMERCMWLSRSLPVAGYLVLLTVLPPPGGTLGPVHLGHVALRCQQPCIRVPLVGAILHPGKPAGHCAPWARSRLALLPNLRVEGEERARVGAQLRCKLRVHVLELMQHAMPAAVQVLVQHPRVRASALYRGAPASAALALPGQGSIAE